MNPHRDNIWGLIGGNPSDDFYNRHNNIIKPKVRKEGVVLPLLVTQRDDTPTTTNQSQSNLYPSQKNVEEASPTSRIGNLEDKGDGKSHKVYPSNNQYHAHDGINLQGVNVYPSDTVGTFIKQTIHELRLDMGRIDNRMDHVVNMSVDSSASLKETNQLLESLSSKINNTYEKAEHIKHKCEIEKLEVGQSLNNLFSRVELLENAGKSDSANTDVILKRFTDMNRLQEIDRENINVRFRDISSQIQHYGGMHDGFSSAIARIESKITAEESARRQGWDILRDKMGELRQDAKSMVHELSKQVEQQECIQSEIQTKLEQILSSSKRGELVESSDRDNSESNVIEVKEEEQMKRRALESEIELTLHKLIDPVIDPLNRKINNGLQDVREAIQEESKNRDDKEAKTYKYVNSVLSQLQQQLQRNISQHSTSMSSEKLKFKSEQGLTDYIEFYILSVKRKLEKELNSKIETSFQNFEQSMNALLAKSTASVMLSHENTVKKLNELDEKVSRDNENRFVEMSILSQKIHATNPSRIIASAPVEPIDQESFPLQTQPHHPPLALKQVVDEIKELKLELKSMTNKNEYAKETEKQRKYTLETVNKLDAQLRGVLATEVSNIRKDMLSHVSRSSDRLFEETKSDKDFTNKRLSSIETSLSMLQTFVEEDKNTKRRELELKRAEQEQERLKKDYESSLINVENGKEAKGQSQKEAETVKHNWSLAVEAVSKIKIEQKNSEQKMMEALETQQKEKAEALARADAAKTLAIISSAKSEAEKCVIQVSEQLKDRIKEQVLQDMNTEICKQVETGNKSLIDKMTAICDMKILAYTGKLLPKKTDKHLMEKRPMISEDFDEESIIGLSMSQVEEALLPKVSRMISESQIESRTLDIDKPNIPVDDGERSSMQSIILDLQSELEQERLARSILEQRLSKLESFLDVDGSEWDKTRNVNKDSHQSLHQRKLTKFAQVGSRSNKRVDVAPKPLLAFNSNEKDMESGSGQTLFGKSIVDGIFPPLPMTPTDN